MHSLIMQHPRPADMALVMQQFAQACQERPDRTTWYSEGQEYRVEFISLLKGQFVAELYSQWSSNPVPIAACIVTSQDV